MDEKLFRQWLEDARKHIADLISENARLTALLRQREKKKEVMCKCSYQRF